MLIFRDSEGNYDSEGLAELYKALDYEIKNGFVLLPEGIDFWDTNNESVDFDGEQ